MLIAPCFLPLFVPPGESGTGDEGHLTRVRTPEDASRSGAVFRAEAGTIGQPWHPPLSNRTIHSTMEARSFG